MSTPTRRRAIVIPAAAALALAPAVLVASPASAATYPVATLAELVAAVDAANASVGIADVIELSADVTIDAALPPITDELTVDGNSFLLDGNGFDLFTIQSTTFAAVDLLIDDAEEGITATGSELTLTGVVITDSAGSGVNATDVDLTMSASQIRGSELTNLVVFNDGATPRTVTITDTQFDVSLTDDGATITQTGTGAVVLTDVTSTDNDDFGIDLSVSDSATATLTRVRASGNPNYGFTLGAIDDARIDMAETSANGNNGGGRVTARDNATIVSTGSSVTSNIGTGWLVENSSPAATVQFGFTLATLNESGFSFDLSNGGHVTIADSLIQGGDYGFAFRPDFFPDPTQGGSVDILRTDVVGSEISGILVALGVTDLDVDFVDGSILDITSTAPGGAVDATLDDTSLRFERATIARNTAEIGGIRALGDDASTLELINSTLDGNAGETFSTLAVETAEVYVEHSTLTATDAAPLAGIAGTEVVVTHSIFEGGTPSLVGGGGAISVDHSLVGDLGGDFVAAVAAGTGNLTDVSANLLPLADNGGFTETRLPEAGSPLIDAGDPAFTAPPATDQRGLARVQGARIDIGAVEQGATLPATGRADAGAVLGLAGLLLAVGGVVVAARRRLA